MINREESSERVKSFEIIHLLNVYLHSNYNNKEAPSRTEDPILDNKDKNSPLFQHLHTTG